MLLGYTLNSKMFGNLDFFFLSKAIIQGKKVDARGGAMSRPAFFVFAWRRGLKAKHIYSTPLPHSPPSIIVSILKTVSIISKLASSSPLC